MADKKDNFYEVYIRRHNIFVTTVSLFTLIAFMLLFFLRWWLGAAPGEPLF